MTPTNHLRWYAPKNHPTADDVRAYATEHDLSMMQAKFELVAAKTPVLQQWWSKVKWSEGSLLNLKDPQIIATGEWRIVPTEDS